jgi:hypothetical protein
MRLLFATLFLFLCVGAVFAQSDRGTITGTVTDPGGAVIASASIEAKSLATGATIHRKRLC